MIKYAYTLPTALPPYQGHPGDAGFDLCSVETKVVYGHTQAMLNTGLAFEIPIGWYGKIEARSSVSRRGIIITGVIDSTYRGPVFLTVINTTKDMFEVPAGHRIAQIIFTPCYAGNLTEVEYAQLSQTHRAADGFGSTGSEHPGQTGPLFRVGGIDLD